jgi:predicted dehydrogenase
VKALKAGKHVMSECMAMLTMGEALELVEAVE